MLTASRGKLSSWLAALVVVAALILAAQFNGPETRFLAAAMTLVIVWLVSAPSEVMRTGFAKKSQKNRRLQRKQLQSRRKSQLRFKRSKTR